MLPTKLENIDAHSVDKIIREKWLEKYKAAMVLGGASDAIAYKRGAWEFQYDGSKIHEELESLEPEWIVSDDTIMHLATAEALIESGQKESDRESLYLTLAKHYKKCMKDMDGRAAGPTCLNAALKLNYSIPGGYKIPFNKKGGGCGAAMRAMCIGMYYPSDKQLDDLIAVSIESGRMTHNHPTGYLGALASALFTHCAIQGYALQSWGFKLMESLDKAWEYVEKQGRDVEENRAEWYYFQDSWKKYLKLRGIEDGSSMPQFPENYGVKERDEFYKSISFSGWGGSSGHDAPMIAYDAILGAKGSWERLSERAFFHGGDNDSTAIIGAVWYGILHGYDGVPKVNYEKLEYKERLEKAAEGLFGIASQHLPDIAPE